MPSWLQIIVLVVLAVAGLMLASPLGRGTAPPGKPDYSADTLDDLIALMRDGQVQQTAVGAQPVEALRKIIERHL